jgi:hypothetical protein
MARLSGFFAISYYVNDEIFVEVESKKQNLEIRTNKTDFEKDVLNSGLSKCRVHEVIKAIKAGHTAGAFTRCGRK